MLVTNWTFTKHSFTQIKWPSQLYGSLRSMPTTTECLPRLSMVAQVCNPGSWEAEVGRTLSLWPSQSTEGIPSQSGLDSKSVKERKSAKSVYFPGPLQKRRCVHCHTLSPISVDHRVHVLLFWFWWLNLFCFEKNSLYVGQAGLHFKEILPPLSPKC